MEIVVRENVEENKALEEEHWANLNRVLESVGLNTPSEGLIRGDDDVHVCEPDFDVNIAAEVETEQEVVTLEPLVELPVEETREEFVEQHVELSMEHVVEEVGVQVKRKC